MAIAGKPTHKMIEIDEVKTIDDVVREFEEIIDWTIEAETPIGYFAVIYKQATVAIREAIKQKRFDNPERMLEFQLTFARRYFSALNAYNDYGDFEMPTLVWSQSLYANAQDEPTIFQHLLTGLNAHMNLDLGIAAATVGRDSMASLRKDFNTVNAVLGYQVESVLDAVSEVSPVIRTMRRCILGEVEMFRGLIVFFREKAWRFAMELANDPERNKEQIDIHDARHVVLGTRYVYTPNMFDSLVNWIASKESRDYSENIRVLNRMPTPGQQQIEEYARTLDETEPKLPMIDDEDGFLQGVATELQTKALAFQRVESG